MTDPSLTPEQEQAVRRALQEVRPTGPPPPDVVARLDATLADLTADRRAERPPAAAAVVAPVVPLATRRRRWAGAGLVAAAAVVLIGVGLGPMVDSWQRGTDAGDDSTTATSLNEEGAAEDSAGGDGEDLDDRFSGQHYSDQDRPWVGPDVPEAASLTVPGIRPAHFDRDVAAARDLPVEPAGGPSYLDSAPPSGETDSQRGSRADCGPTAGTDERSVPVTYRRQPAILLFRAPVGDAQVVELHLCRDVGPERVTTLPAP